MENTDPLKLIVARRPVAGKGRAKNKKYADSMQKAAAERITAPLARDARLYCRIIWFHRRPTQQDVDNIVGPILDSLKGVVFNDDFQVAQCSVTRINLEEEYRVTPGNDPAGDSYNELLDMINAGHDDHILQSYDYDGGREVFMTKIMQTLEDVRIDGRDLEEKKIKDLNSELCDEGYTVEQQAGADDGFDLIAHKGGRKLAIKVKVNTDLAESLGAIRNLRTRAREDGYDEFRLVIVRALHEDNISIAGLEEKLPELMESYLKNPANRTEVEKLKLDLFSFLSSELTPELGVLTNRRFFGGAFGTDIKSVAIEAHGRIRVVGSGAVEIRGLEDSEMEGTELYPDVPFDFDITFNSNLESPQINKLEFQISGLTV